MRKSPKSSHPRSNLRQIPNRLPKNSKFSQSKTQSLLCPPSLMSFLTPRPNRFKTKGLASLLWQQKVSFLTLKTFSRSQPDLKGQIKQKAVSHFKISPDILVSALKCLKSISMILSKIKSRGIQTDRTWISTSTTVLQKRRGGITLGTSWAGRNWQNIWPRQASFREPYRISLSITRRLTSTCPTSLGALTTLCHRVCTIYRCLKLRSRRW